MRKIIFLISFCIAGLFSYSQMTRDPKKIPEPPTHLVKIPVERRVITPNFTARCFGTITADGKVKSGSGNFSCSLWNEYYYIYIDSNLLKNSTILMNASRAEQQCSFLVSESNRYIFVSVHDISKSYASTIEAEFHFAVFKR